MLRAGKTKSILESSIESALLAVEIYNKPQIPFKSQNYITLMVIAWTKLFHAHFNNTIGDRYYYKDKSGRYEKIDGEKKAWELQKCINEYGILNQGIKSNLKFFIKIRNKIEHRHVNSCEIDEKIFGECQSFLYNYEKTLVDFFGEEYAIGVNLAYSLQFSRSMTKGQKESIKKQRSQNIEDLKDFISEFRHSLDDQTYNSQEFSIKLIQIPKITNSNRADLAIEFVNVNNLDDKQKEEIGKIYAIVKYKTKFVEVANHRNYRISDVLKSLNDQLQTTFNLYDLTCLNYIFSIKPFSGEGKDPSETYSDFCIYDKVHRDHVYTEKYCNFLRELITSERISQSEWREFRRNKRKISLSDYV